MIEKKISNKEFVVLTILLVIALLLIFMPLTMKLALNDKKNSSDTTINIPINVQLPDKKEDIDNEDKVEEVPPKEPVHNITVIVKPNEGNNNNNNNGNNQDNTNNDQDNNDHNDKEDFGEDLKNLRLSLLEDYLETNTVGLLKDEKGYYYKGTNEEVGKNYVWFAGHLWRVIGIDNNHNLTLITQQPITAIDPAIKAWSNEQEYKGSYIYKWLNEVFLGSMQATDRARILENVYNVGPDGNVSGIVAVGKAGLLDREQYVKAGMGSSFLGNKDFFWLASPYESYHLWAACNDRDLCVNDMSGLALGVRPVIKIPNLTAVYGEGTLDNPYREKSKTTSTNDIKVGEYISVPTNGMDCGNDKRCLFRVVSKDNDSIKVILNGLLPTTSEFGLNTTYTSDSGIDIILTSFANTIDSKYRYTENKTFNIGTYPYQNRVGQDYHMVTEKIYSGTVGLPVVGEMFSGNDIDVSKSTFKNFVNVTTIENPTAFDSFWFMNAWSTTYVRNMYSDGNSTGGNTISLSGLRPTLFLKNNLKFTSGNGTAEHPYRLG